LRALPFLDPFRPLKVEQAQEAFKMNIRELAVDLAQNEMEEVRADLLKTNGNRYANGTGAHMLRRKGGRQNLLTNLGE